MKKIVFLTFLAFTSISVKSQITSGKHLIKYLEINTTQSDYGTTFLGDDKVVFAMPFNEKSRVSQSDLFIGDIGEKGEITSKELVKGIRQLKKVSKTGITYSNDLKIVYFSAKKDKRKKSSEKDQLFKARIDASGNWINIEKLPFNDKKYSTGQPTLSKDGKKLYFVSNRQGAYGGSKDIFVVDVKYDGTYGKPTNLGNKVNTNGDEITPFITDDNILYFSSNGHNDGQGDLDIYASQISENTGMDLFHLEAPINSVNNDFAYIINKKNDAGYFSSNRLQGQDNNDIYSFILEEPVPEKCLQEIAGIVKDKETQEVLNDAAMTLFDEEGNQVEQIITDNNGAYKFTLDCNQTYTLMASSLYYVKEEHIINTANYMNAPSLEANKFLVKKSGTELKEAIAVANGEEAIEDEAKEVVDTLVETTEDTTKKEQTPEVKVTEEEVAVEETQKTEEVVNESEATFNSVYFGFDKSNITNQAARELDKIVTILSDNDALEIEVSSYTDSRGSSAYNIGLSNRRAKSTVDYLISQGIDRNRIKAKGYGESRMINKCVNGVECSEAAHAKNRRTEFVILNSQAYNDQPIKKGSSKEALSITETKKDITKKKEIIVAKHLYNNKDTDDVNKSIVSKNKNDLKETNEDESISLNDETNVSKIDSKEDILIVGSENHKSDKIEELTSTDKLVGTQENQNNSKDNIENQPISLVGEKNVLEIDNNEDELAVTNNKSDSDKEVNDAVKIKNSSGSNSSQITEKESEVISKNQPLAKADNEESVSSDNLDKEVNSETVSRKENLINKSDLSIVSSNDDHQIASNQLVKKKRYPLL